MRLAICANRFATKLFCRGEVVAAITTKLFCRGGVVAAITGAFPAYRVAHADSAGLRVRPELAVLAARLAHLGDRAPDPWGEALSSPSEPKLIAGMRTASFAMAKKILSKPEQVGPCGE